MTNESILFSEQLSYDYLFGVKQVNNISDKNEQIINNINNNNNNKSIINGDKKSNNDNRI